jgi:hypothetical protein
MRWLALLAPGAIILRQAVGEPAPKAAREASPGQAIVLVDAQGVVLTSDNGEQLVAGGPA